MKFIVGIFLALLSGATFAGNKLAEGVIYNVGNSTGSTVGNFAIFIKSTATVPCPEGYGIVFFVGNAPNEKAFDRAYAASLMALASGQKVVVYGTQDNDCSTAAYITVLSN